MKKTVLIIDGNLLARKSFYNFKNLSSTISLKTLMLLSKNLKEQTLKRTVKEETFKEEFISEESGHKLSLNVNGRIDKKVRELSALGTKITLYTGTLYGMLRSILIAYEKYNIDKVVICYDPIYRTGSEVIQLRKELIPDYKNRKKDPKIEILFSDALSLAQSFFYKAGITQTTTKLFEADDLLQYYTHKVYKEHKCLVLTNDHDLFQLLVPNRVRMLRLGKDKGLYTASDFTTKYGISPNQWKDVLTLGGCSTDNVKGVRGISSNKAVGLIRDYGSLKNLIKTYKSNPPEKRIITALEKEREQNFKNIKLSLHLVSLYGLKKQLKDDITIIKSSKSSKICLKQALMFLNLLEFRSFTTESAKKSLKSLIYKKGKCINETTK